MKHQVICLSIFLFALFSDIYAKGITPTNEKAGHKQLLDTIPFEFAKNKIIIPVLLSGKQRRFILDTGAPLIITKELQQECRFELIKKELVSDINQNLDTAYLLQIPQIQIGNMVFDKAQANLADLNASMLSCFRIDGIIGSNLLKNTILHIDYRQKIIILTNQIDKLNLSVQSRIPLLLEERQYTPIIDIKPFPQAREQIFIDTGDDGFYSMGLRSFLFFMEQTNLKDYLVSQTKGADVYGLYGLEKDTTKHLLHLDSLSIGKYYFSEVRTMTYTNPNSRIGAALLRYGTVTIDYLNKQFYFIPFSERQSIIVQQGKDSKLGFSLRSEENLLTVSVVWEGSQAWQKGIKTGEIIEKINDYELVGKSICELLFLWEQIFEKETEYKITLSDRQGNRKTITLLGL